MQYLVIAFSSRSLAMQAQNIFARRGIPATLINTPREVDGSCGLSLRTNSRYRDAALRAVETTLLKTSVKAIALIDYLRSGEKSVRFLTR